MAISTRTLSILAMALWSLVIMVGIIALVNPTHTFGFYGILPWQHTMNSGFVTPWGGVQFWGDGGAGLFAPGND